MADTELTKFRSLTGPIGIWEKILLVAIPVAGIVFVSDAPFYLGLAILKEQYLENKKDRNSRKRESKNPWVTHGEHDFSEVPCGIQSNSEP